MLPFHRTTCNFIPFIQLQSSFKCLTCDGIKKFAQTNAARFILTVDVFNSYMHFLRSYTETNGTLWQSTGIAVG